MAHLPEPAERFAQHSRLSELVTALGFRRHPLFLAGLLYEQPGGPLRRATAVVSHDGDLVAPTTPARCSSRSKSCSKRADLGGFTISRSG